MFVSVKTKGSATVNDTQFGSFFSLICEVLGIESETWNKKCEYKPKPKKEDKEKAPTEEKTEKIEENDPIDASKNTQGFPETILGLGHDHFSLFPLKDQQKHNIPVFQREKLGVITPKFRLRDHIIENKDKNKACHILHKFWLSQEDLQSFDFELCGRKEPHLVKYDFGIDLKPLFFGLNNGELSPYYHKLNPEVSSYFTPELQDSDAKTKESSGFDAKIHSNSDMEMKIRQYGPWKIEDSKEVIKFCQNIQKRDLWLNTEFRKMNGLSVRYEHDHFIHEGFVLYLLVKLKGSSRMVVTPYRALYKVHFLFFSLSG